MNKLCSILAALCGVASAQAAMIEYNFNDGTLQGWTNLSISTASAGYYDLRFAPVANEHGWDTTTNNPGLGAYFLGETPGTNDSKSMTWASWPAPASQVHQTLWIQSPAFVLNGSGPLTYFGCGSMGAVNPATGNRDISLKNTPIPQVAGTWGIESGNSPATSGTCAVGLRRDDGAFVLSRNFSNFADGWVNYSFTTAELQPFVNDGHTYTLNLVDFLAGTAAWAAIDNISIPGDAPKATLRIALKQDSTGLLFTLAPTVGGNLASAISVVLASEDLGQPLTSWTVVKWAATQYGSTSFEIPLPASNTFYRVVQQDKIPETLTPGATVASLAQPLAPAQRMSGPCVLRYIESTPDDHLNLQIRTVNGQVLLSDTSTIHLQGCTYTLNGWTDPIDASHLTDEPIQPYTLYHVTKVSIAAPMREWWRSAVVFEKDNPIEIHRSELFFTVVPAAETWNGAGQSANPIGRPLAFSQLPAFKLTNHIYGFDTTFSDETSQRLDQLDITFNRKPGQCHTMLYSSVLQNFIQSKGYDNPRKPIQSFSDQDCIDYANSLSPDLILSFDVEPPPDWQWMIDYSNPNYIPNMSKVINRLNARGVKAYDWMSGARFSISGVDLEGFKSWGSNNEQMDTYLNAYAHPDQIAVPATPNKVINVGFGYDSYDYDFLPADTNNQNSSPQALILKELDACELAARVYTNRDLLAFTWGFMEWDVSTFPVNHVVEIPSLNATARCILNKPIYAPSVWQDNMTLAFLYCHYLYYWSPGITTWDPVHVARYAKPNLQPGELETWEFIKGTVPTVTGASYPGKESMIYNATIAAASRYAQIQSICDKGARTAVATTYRRADHDGNLGAAVSFPAYSDGSQYVQAAKNHQPFTIVATDPATGHKVVFFQDVWSRPGRSTEFSFIVDGKIYSNMTDSNGQTVPLCTEGNRLFIGLVD